MSAGPNFGNCFYCQGIATHICASCGHPICDSPICAGLAGIEVARSVARPVIRRTQTAVGGILAQLGKLRTGRPF